MIFAWNSSIICKRPLVGADAALCGRGGRAVGGAALFWGGGAASQGARAMDWLERRGSGRGGLAFVVNNSRFLVLPERQRYPNLASRVLGLCLRRLSADWQERWGHPVLVVESFVDESRYRGTCYRACGFEAVGLDGRLWSGQPGFLPGTRPAQTALLAGAAKGRARVAAAGAAAQGTGPARAEDGRALSVSRRRTGLAVGAFPGVAGRGGAATACGIGSPLSWPARRWRR